MTDDDGFAALLQRVRDGDEQAAEVLVKRYEPEIRRMVRVRLNDPTLRPVLDSMDICQSILARFFIRVQAGELSGLKEPGQVLGLLIKMASDRVIDRARMQRAARRDRRRLQPIDTAGGGAIQLAAGDASPSRIAVGRELIERLRSLLSEDVYRLAERRAEGASWQELAEETGEEADALRKRLARALARVEDRLDLS